MQIKGNDEWKEIYNYITDLQEKYNNSQITLAEEWKKRLEAEEKNKHLDNQITMLKQQNNAITEMGLDYKSKNEKAIEYNKKNIKSKTLNDILQGGEE